MFNPPPRTVADAPPTPAQRWVASNTLDTLKDALAQARDNELPLKTWATSHEYVSVRLKSQLYDAILQNDDNTVRALLSRYPESLHQTYRGFTPLYLAVSQGNNALVKTLLNEGAPVWQPQDGEYATWPTALIEEALRKFRQNSHSSRQAQPYFQLLARLLQACGLLTEEHAIGDVVRACVNVKYAQEQRTITDIVYQADSPSSDEANNDNDNHTAYNSVDVAWAASQNRGCLAQLLLALRGDIEGVYQGKTALAWAAYHNDSETVMALLDAGACPMQGFQRNREDLTEAQARLANVHDTLQLDKEESERWEVLEGHLQRLTTQQHDLTATVETQQAMLAEHQAWLKRYQSHAFNRAAITPPPRGLREIRQSPCLSLFYSTIEFYLSNILLATKALASGRIAHQKNKQSEVVSFFLPLIGDSVPFPGVGAFMQVLEWGASYELGRRQEKRTRQAAEPLQTVGMIDHIAGTVATYLTNMFSASLQDIACSHPNTGEALEKEKTEEAIQKLGQCAVARVISFLRNRALDKTSALGVSEQLALSVLYYTRKTGALPFQSTSIVTYNATTTEQKKVTWTDEGIFQRSVMVAKSDEEKAPLFYAKEKHQTVDIPGRDVNPTKYPPCVLPTAWVDALKAIYAEKALKEGQRKVIRRKAGKRLMDETTGSPLLPEGRESATSPMPTAPALQDTASEPAATEKPQAPTRARLGLFQAPAPATQREWQVQKETLVQQNEALGVLQQQFQQAERVHTRQHEETQAKITQLADQLKDLCTRLEQVLPTTAREPEQITPKR